MLLLCKPPPCVIWPRCCWWFGKVKPACNRPPASYPSNQFRIINWLWVHSCIVWWWGWRMQRTWTEQEVHAVSAEVGKGCGFNEWMTRLRCLGLCENVENTSWCTAGKTLGEWMKEEIGRLYGAVWSILLNSPTEPHAVCQLKVEIRSGYSLRPTLFGVGE